MPNRTKTVLEILGAEDTRATWGALKPGTSLQKHMPLFPRIEVPKPVDKEQSKTKPDKDVNVITYDEFKKVELKTAEVLAAEKVAGADRLLKLQIRVGEVGEEQRQLVAGIAEYYRPDELIGKMIVIVANLKPAKIRGIESNGMLLAAKKGKKLTLITIDDSSIESGAGIY